MQNYTEKQQIIESNPELELCENGDFRIKPGLIEDYEIIDSHCHIFKSVSQLFPAFLQRENEKPTTALIDKSCFPFSMHLFDLNKVYFSDYPMSLRSVDGVKARFKLFAGALVLNYATVNRLLSDMDNNAIREAVVLQINPPGKSCCEDMEEIVSNNRRIHTFASIHPFDKDIPGMIDKCLKMHIKGWKLNPHIWGVPIDDERTVKLLLELSKTGLPILSCSGIGLPQEMMASSVPTKKTIQDSKAQKLDRFRRVLDKIPDVRFIMAHGGCYETEEIIGIMKEFPNTYTDISIQPAQNIARLIQEIGSDRIMFGTDYPFVSQAFSILSVLRATSDDCDRKNIFSHTARCVMGF